MKYRDHRELLADSMKTVREVSSVEEIKQHLNDYYNQFGWEVEEIRFSPVCYDCRIGWNTYNVLYRLKGGNDFYVAGMTDGCLDDKLLI